MVGGKEKFTSSSTTEDRRHRATAIKEAERSSIELSSRIPITEGVDAVAIQRGRS